MLLCTNLYVIVSCWPVISKKFIVVQICYSNYSPVHFKLNPNRTDIATSNRINIRIEHVNHSKCRQDFMTRVKENELKRKVAKEKNIVAVLKRQVIIFPIIAKK